MNNRELQSNSDGFRFMNAESYSSRLSEHKELSSGRNSIDQQNYDNVIYREEKESMIDIPKLFKL